MEEQTIKILVDAIKKEFAAVKFPSPEEAQQLLHDLDEGKKPTGVTAQELGIVLGLFRAAEENFRKRPEPTPRQLEQVRKEIEGKFRYTLRDALLKIGKKLPHRPGGRSRSLKPAQRETVLKQIGDLVRIGQKESEAMKTLAIRWNVSVKTIQRACKEKQEELRKQKKDGNQ